MIEFSKQISEKWNIPITLSEQLCNAYLKGDNPYYLIEYQPETAVVLTDSALLEIFDFLNCMHELSSKKKRVLNALKKAGNISSAIERHVNLTSNSFELDDMLLPLRPNPRSKGQLASKKGLSPISDEILYQKEELRTIEELVSPYIGKDPSLSSVEDVVQSVKEILAERIAYDETVRVMCREFTYDDGFFEIIPKNRKDPEYAKFVGKIVPLKELSKEQILKLMVAEDLKVVRLKVGVQLFRITELVRHHFITNPDAVGFNLICEAIDESWLRLLQPVIERDVKIRLREEAEAWASKQLIGKIEKVYDEELRRGPVLLVNAAHDKNILLIAISGQGNFLGATNEKKPPEGKTFSSDRLRLFLNRHKPFKIIIVNNEQARIAESILLSAINGLNPLPTIELFTPDETFKNASESAWVQKEFSALLDENMRVLYGNALQYLKPISLVPKLGTSYYSFHHLQGLINHTNLSEMINRIIVIADLRKGVVVKDILDSHLKSMPLVTMGLLQAIRNAESKGEIQSKNDLLSVEGMTELLFRNIAGFIIFPTAENILDRTLVHPDHFIWFLEMSDEFNVSVDTIVSDPEILHSYTTDDPVKKVYVEKKLISFISVASRFLSAVSPKAKRKHKLNELKEGAVVSGRVTNITPFGVFININAVCDGLIHISQLADEYVETPEQVVQVNDKVDVRILKVDVKKRRISLSMKNLGHMAPKVRPSQGQLDHLAEHFKNR